MEELGDEIAKEKLPRILFIPLRAIVAASGFESKPKVPS
jgi:hypothetical protein